MIYKNSDEEKKKKVLKNEGTEKFVRKEQYYALNEIIKEIPSICKKIEDGLKYEMKLYEDKITKDPTEFVVQIDEIKTKINEINMEIVRKVDKVKEKYTNPKGIILIKTEEKILELKKEIEYLDTKNDDSINELKKISLEKIKELKETCKIIQRDIVEECNKEFDTLIDRFEVIYPILELDFTEEDLKNMEDEIKKDISEEKSYETGIIFKKTHFYSEYSKTKHFEILKENILGKMNEIQIEVVNNLIDFVNNISSE
ncbi:hypothetical protein, partial [uncultured Leptotrichia sp.]|uniref:hypothetical protein n=1 Tax=uncultured Leptotrichia sp. TaxID=159271 RepID=UPI0025D8D671